MLITFILCIFSVFITYLVFIRGWLGVYIPLPYPCPTPCLPLPYPITTPNFHTIFIWIIYLSTGYCFIQLFYYLMRMCIHTYTYTRFPTWIFLFSVSKTNKKPLISLGFRHFSVFELNKKPFKRLLLFFLLLLHRLVTMRFINS